MNLVSMMRKSLILAAGALCLVFEVATVAQEQTQTSTTTGQATEVVTIQAADDNAKTERARVKASGDALDELVTSQNGIPTGLLNKSECVIILPSVKKVGFIIAGQYGRGLMTCRTGANFDGPWSAPIMMQSTGGSVGLQAGGQSTDFVILVLNDKGARALMKGKAKLGADASIAAGPVGREAEAATNAAMSAEMLSYSEANGLFAGVSLSGTSLGPDEGANEKLYGKKVAAEQIYAGEVQAPVEANQMLATLQDKSPKNLSEGKADLAQAAGPAESPNKIWSDLMDGNKRFVAGQLMPQPVVKVRGSLTKSQHPKAMVLSCSDSRVPPELVFDQTLGDLFVVRAAGNIAGPLGLASLEYAFDHLGSTVLVVLGHTQCGAVSAACSGERMPTANLQAMVDQIDPAVKKVKGSATGNALIEAAIKENVHESARGVLAHSEVLQHAKEQGKLTVIEAEYQLDTGEVVRLDKAAQ
jgi:lipid-binding SYLF domain-containing protein/carbonic anhydrase